MKRLLIITLASSVLFCDGSLAAQLQRSQNYEQSRNKLTAEITETVNGTDKTKNTTKTSNTRTYNSLMKAGYKAFDKKDYKTALSNFKSALAIRPNNIYAKKAIQNTEKKIGVK